MQGCIGRPSIIITGRQTFDILDTVEHRPNEVQWKMHGKMFYLERHAIKLFCLNWEKEYLFDQNNFVTVVN